MTVRRIVVASLLLASSGIVVISLLAFPPAGKDSSKNRCIEFTEVRPIHDTLDNLESFFVNLKDKHRHYRVLVCDIAIMMNPDKKILGNKSELRKKAYIALKNKGTRMCSTSSRSCSTIKKKIQDELNRLQRGGIKEVYFTNL